MFKNYFKMAYRSLLRNKLSSSINMVGLSVAIGCSIVFFLMLDLEYTSDLFHENAKNIFMIGYTLEGDERADRWGDSPQPLGPILAAEFPQVKHAIRINDRTGTVRYGDKVFNEAIRFVDPQFLSVFTFPLRLGDETALSDKQALILSEAMADKYFGDENPVGKQVVITFSDQVKESFFIRGVAEKFHFNTSFQFSILGSYGALKDIVKMDMNDWGTFVGATFVEVNHPDDISTISAQMNRYVQRHNAERIDRPIASFFLEPLPTLSWESQEIHRSISSGSTPQALIMLFVIGLFLLLQACSNYVNITLASGTRRFKEIGIRKVVGSQRIQLINQFLGENLLLCFLALIGGLFLTEFILLPGLMEISGANDEIGLLNTLGGTHLWIFIIVLLVLTGIGGGAYPALVISRLQPVRIMKGKVKIGGKKRFTSILLSIQFGLTFLILCLVVTFLQNNQYQRKRDWGYHQDHVINIRLEKADQFHVFKNAVAQNPNVIQTAGTLNAIGRSQEQAVVELEAQKYEVIRFDVGFNYLKTLGIRLKEGRFFDPDLSTDRDVAIVINDQFVREMNWQQAIGQTLRYDDRIVRVIGVVEDFHYTSFFEEIGPVLFRLAPNDSFSVLAIRVKPGTGIQSFDTFKETWQNLFPDSPYDRFFQDSVFENAFRNNEIITKIFAATACITLIISCMGLFGLVTLMISKRAKEFSVHKVMGASVPQIAQLITRRFVMIITISILLAIPAGYIALITILDAIYPYHMTLGGFPFALAGSVVLITAVSTIAWQVYNAAVRNPIDAIRYE